MSRMRYSKSWTIAHCVRCSVATENSHDIHNVTALLPTHYFSTHQCAIRSIAWIRAPTFSARGELSHDDPTVILGGGYDGLLSATDIREVCGNEVYRTRGKHTLEPYSVMLIGYRRHQYRMLLDVQWRPRERRPRPDQGGFFRADHAQQGSYPVGS